ncbi:hypothetical protein [Nocardia sp. NPDC050710]|uniref:hypothetical protein n=1 Tax=Nocardia sp. NPDC050710 TaxID=3157220 RepID=UPI0033D1FACE
MPEVDPVGCPPVAVPSAFGAEVAVPGGGVPGSEPVGLAAGGCTGRRWITAVSASAPPAALPTAAVESAAPRPAGLSRRMTVVSPLELSGVAAVSSAVRGWSAGAPRRISAVFASGPPGAASPRPATASRLISAVSAFGPPGTSVARFAGPRFATASGLGTAPRLPGVLALPAGPWFAAASELGAVPPWFADVLALLAAAVLALPAGLRFAAVSELGAAPPWFADALALLAAVLALPVGPRFAAALMVGAVPWFAGVREAAAPAGFALPAAARVLVAPPDSDAVAGPSEDASSSVRQTDGWSVAASACAVAPAGDTVAPVFAVCSRFGAGAGFARVADSEMGRRTGVAATGAVGRSEAASGRAALLEAGFAVSGTPVDCEVFGAPAARDCSVVGVSEPEALPGVPERPVDDVAVAVPRGSAAPALPCPPEAAAGFPAAGMGWVGAAAGRAASEAGVCFAGVSWRACSALAVPRAGFFSSFGSDTYYPSLGRNSLTRRQA